MKTFDDFWTAFPRHVGKKAARKAWDHINPQNGQSESIIEAVELQKRHNWRGKDPQFIPHASTWLNGERWEDDIEQTEQNESREQAKTRRNAEAAREAVEFMSSHPGDGFGGGDHETENRALSTAARRFNGRPN